MEISVIHKAPSTPEHFFAQQNVKVDTVHIADENGQKVEDYLEQAFHLTQNSDENNYWQKNLYRSTHTGDLMLANGEVYEVAPRGFFKIA